MKKQQLLIILVIFIPLACKSQFIGLNYTPGRIGAGISIGNDKFIIGCEKGYYKSCFDGYTEKLNLSKITGHIAIYKYNFKKGYVVTYAGFGYNEFKGETNILLDKENLYKISFEIGGIVNMGIINPMIFVDFVNWEGKFGLNIKF